jgi:hypothetical protein
MGASIGRSVAPDHAMRIALQHGSAACTQPLRSRSIHLQRMSAGIPLALSVRRQGKSGQARPVR